MKPKWVPLSAGALGLALVVSQALAEGAATVETVQLEADTWISQDTAAENHGTEIELVVGSPVRRRALVRASRSAIEQAIGARRLVAARLELTIASLDRHWGQAHGEAARTIDVHALTTPWTETGATWLSPTSSGRKPAATWDMNDDRRGGGKHHDQAEPGPFRPTRSASATVAQGQTGVVGFDLTQDVLELLDGTAENHGWLLKRSVEEPAGRISFGAREGGSAPRLVLTVETPSGVVLRVVTGDRQTGPAESTLTQPLVVEARGSSGPLTGLPVAFEVLGGDAALVEAQPVRTDAAGRASARVRLGPSSGVVTVRATTVGATPVTFRALALPGPVTFSAVADTYVSRSGPKHPRGAEHVLEVSPIGSKRALVRFDPDALRNAVFPDQVEHARLELTTLGAADLPVGQPSFELGMHRVTQAWSELGATWNTPSDHGPSWSMGGSPLPFTAEATNTVTVVRGQTGVVSWDVTADVATLLADDEPHDGWLVKSVRENGPGSVAFASREGGTSPRLVVLVRDVTSPVVTIESPAQGACAGPSMPVQIAFSDARSGIEPGSLVVRVNGQDRTSDFVVTGSTAASTLGALAASLGEGETNEITCSVRDLAQNEGAASVSFEYDATPPTLVLAPADQTIVTTLTIPVQLTATDAGCGIAGDTLRLTADGQDVPVALVGDTATADLALTPGPHTLVASVEDAAGNRTEVTSHFQLIPRGVRGVVLGGTSGETATPVAGARVRALDGPPVETFTDVSGAFTLGGATLGRVRVLVDGLLVGHGRTTTVVEVQDGVVLTLGQPIVLPPLDPAAGVEVPLDASGRTTSEVVVTSPESAGFELRIAAGSQVLLPDDGFALPPGEPLRISVRRLVGSTETVPLPLGSTGEQLVLPGVYSLQPEGVTVVEGYTLTISNEAGAPAGSSTPLYQFEPSLGQWFLKTQLTVSPDEVTAHGVLNTVISRIANPRVSLINSAGRQALGVSSLLGEYVYGVGPQYVAWDPQRWPGGFYLRTVHPAETGTALGVAVNGSSTTEPLTMHVSGGVSERLLFFELPGVNGPGPVADGVFGLQLTFLGSPTLTGQRIGYVDRTGATGTLSVDGQTDVNRYMRDQLVIDVTDLTGGLQRVEVEFGGGPWFEPWKLPVQLQTAAAGVYHLGDSGQLGPVHVRIHHQPFPNPDMKGVHTFRLRVVDTANNIRYIPSPAGVQVVIDRTAPSFDVGFPSFHDPKIRRGLAQVDFRVHDDQNVARVELYEDSGLTPIAVATSRGGASSFQGSFTFFNFGRHSYFLKVFDEAGNASTSSPTTYTFDDQGPVVSGSATPVVAAGQQARVTFTASDAPVGLDTWSVRRALAGAPHIQAPVAGGSFPTGVTTTQTVQVDDTTAPMDGRYVYRVVAADVLGNTRGVVTNTVVVDSSAPIVTITPGDGTVLGAGAFTILVTIDDLIGVDPGTIQVLCDGSRLTPSSISTVTLPNGDPQTTITVPVTRLVEGAHTLRVEVIDLAGNPASAHVGVIVDNTAPEVDTLTPNNVLLATSPVTFDATYHDAGAGVNPAAVKVLLSSPLGSTPIDVTAQATIGAGSASVTLPLGEGLHGVAVVVVDMAGNAGLPKLATVAIDTTPPGVTITDGPTAGQFDTDRSPRFVASLNDALGIELASVRVLLDGTDVTARAVVSPVQVSFQPHTPLGDGSHLLEVKARDLAGHTASASLSFMIDATGPTQPGVPVAGARPRESTTTLRWTSSIDGGVGLKEYVVERAEDGRTWTEAGRTTTTELTVPFPTAERTRFRVVAVDLLGNGSAPAEAEGSEVAGLEDLTQPVTTTLVVEVTRAGGSAITDAVITERHTGAVLVHVGNGRYSTPSPVTVLAGQALNLDVVADGETFVSGPLLPLLPSQVVTDFGQLVIHKRRLLDQVIGIAGQSLPAPGVAGLGFTMGEPTASGPPPAESDRHELLSGFWHTVDVTSDPVVSVLQVPPTLRTRYVPIYFEVVADGSTDVTAELSRDQGASWAPLTVASGSLADLAGTPLGRRYVIVWDVGQDMATQSLADVQVRLSPAARPERGDVVDTTLVRAFSVTSVTPASGTLDLAAQEPIAITFDHDVTSSPSNLAASISLTDAGTGVAFPLSFSVSGPVVTVTPQDPLPARAQLQLKVLPGLESAGELVVFDQHPFTPGLSPFEASYRVTGPDVEGPSLISSSPTDGSGGVPPGSPIVLTFSEALDPASLGSGSVVLTSSAEGSVPVSVVLLADPRMVLVQPATALMADRCYTASISPLVRDLAGNAMGRAEHVTFSTLGTSPATPAPPVITSPADGTVITTTSTAPVTTSIAGTAAPFTTVRIYVNGLATGLLAPVDESGDFSVESFNLPEGTFTISGVAMHPSGTPASAPSAAVTVTIDSGRAPATAPPPASAPELFEVAAGTGNDSYYARTITFTGPAGQPVNLRITPNNPSNGPFAVGQITVAGANGGGSFTLLPGEQVLPGGSFDASGSYSLTCGQIQVPGDGATFTLEDAFTNVRVGDAQTVSAVAPTTFVFAPTLTTSEPTFPCGSTSVIRLRAGPSFDTIRLSDYPICIRAVDEFGAPTDAVTINGQPGSKGANIQLDGDGNAPFSVEINDPTVSFRLIVCAQDAYADAARTEHLTIGESDLITPNAYFHSTKLTGYLRPEPAQWASLGGRTITLTKDCPPEPTAAGPPSASSTQGPISEPVLLHSGGETFAATDLVIDCRGFQIPFTRVYKSFVLFSSVLGHRWTHNYDQQIVELPGGDVAWLTGTVRQETFRRQPDGSFVSSTGVYHVLTVTNGVGTLRLDGQHLVFRRFNAPTAPGKLDQIVPRNARNALRFDYHATGPGRHQISAWTDPLDRRVTFSYDLRGRLRQLQDFVGRTWTYEYSQHHDLIRVTSPDGLVTTEGDTLLPGQQFPGGRQVVYGYTRGFADERVNHLLVFAVAPEQAQTLQGAPISTLEDLAVLAPLSWLENTYELRPESRSFARVIRQRIGGSSLLPAWTGQAAAEEAGGTMSFDYQQLAVPVNASLNHPVNVTRVIDREGNLSEYFHNRAGQLVRLRQHANRALRPRATGTFDPRQGGPGEDPEYFERTWVYNHDGLPLAIVNPSGSVWRFVYGDEDLDGDGLLTPGDDRNGDGDFDDPEDVQPEDTVFYAFAPGNGQLDRRARNGQRNLLIVAEVPDARGDTRGGQRPRVWTYGYEPVYNRLRAVTNPCGNDPTYTPQNGGTWSPDRYTDYTYFDYQQGPVAAVRPALASELGVTVSQLDQLLADAGVQLGLGDLNEYPGDDGFTVGNVVQHVQPPITLSPEQTTLRAAHGPVMSRVSSVAHNEFGQVVQAIDAEHNLHRIEYHPEGDPNGDGAPDSTLSGSTGGYVKAVVTDDRVDGRRNTRTNVAPVRATTRFFQDRLGHVVRSIDARGVEHRASFNLVGDPVRTRSAVAIVGPVVGEPAAALVPVDYDALLFHNRNGALVEARVENAGERDGTGVTVGSNPYWTTKVALNLLDDPVYSLTEVDPIANDDTITVFSPGVLVSRATYTKNQQVELAIRPEGGTTLYSYDERGLPFQVTDGFGGQDAATYTFHYTVNGNRQLVVDALKSNPSKWPQFPGDVTRTKYDGFDEVLCVTDAELNCGDSVYDPCGRRVRFVRHGPPDEGLPRLLESEFFYDEGGRPFRVEARVFATQDAFSYPGWDRSIPLPGAAVPSGESEATSLSEHDALGRVIRAVDPKLDESHAVWDGAGRVVSAFGPEFADLLGQSAVRNEARVVYNQAGQPVSVTSFDRSPVTGQQSFTSTAVYDALGRLVQATDAAGQTGRLLYDSRSNVIAASDAKSTVTVANLPGLLPASINGHGNVARTFYDGLSRPIRSEVLLKRNGVGDGSLDDTNLDTSNPANPDGKITIEQRFDRNSRLVARNDDNGNTTAYAYDSRDRLVYTVGADLSVQRTIYDADSMVRQTVDRNGTVIDRTYDAIGRLLKVQATLRATNLEGTGQAVEGTAVQAFEYDGLSRLRLAVDQNDPLDPGDDVVTSFTYDSLSRQLTERHRFRAQTSLVNTFTTNNRITVGAAGIDRTITREFDLDSNRTATTYSSGRRLDYLIDGADRLQAITDSLGTITATEFLGGRPIASTTGRGTVSTSYSYDQKRRLTGLDHLGPGGQRIAGFSNTWDRADRRSSETHLAAPGVQARTESYTYDSAYRITQVAFGDARPNTSWVIDGVGNWVSRTEGGQTQTTNQRQNGKYAPDLMNEVQRLATFDALGSLLKDEQQTQDPNGNRIRSGEFRLSFDVFDRLVRVERTSDGQTVGRYRYDALGRRVDRWFVAKGEAVGQQVFHVSDGAQEVEEIGASGSVVADYVWGGLYLDQVVQVRRGGQEYFAHTNSMFSVAALTDASGAVVERYEYASIYGVCEVRDAAGAPRGSSEEIGNPWRFQGRRYDPESGFYYFRLRYLDPEQGRFVNRDPLGIWGDAGNLGNGYAFAGNDPVNQVDPFGLMSAAEWAQYADAQIARMRLAGARAYVSHQVSRGRFTYTSARKELDQFKVDAANAIIFGGLELVGGVALAPFTLGGSLIGTAHGLDSLSAAIGTASSGEVQTTYTSQAGAGISTWLGASPETAQTVGWATDLGVALVPVGMGLRNLAIAALDDIGRGAGEGFEQGFRSAALELQTTARPAEARILLSGTHAAVEIQTAAGQVQRTHLVVTGYPPRVTATPPASAGAAGYNGWPAAVQTTDWAGTTVLTRPLTAAQAEAGWAAQAAATGRGPLVYQYGATSCVTHVNDVLQAAGVQINHQVMVGFQNALRAVGFN